MKMLHWVEDGVERTLDFDRVATLGYDAVKRELRILVWEHEGWEEGEVVIVGDEAERLRGELTI